MPLIKQEDLNGLNTTDYTLQNIKEHRKRMVGRYSYLFTKPYNELQGFEIHLYWYLKGECYDCLTSSLNDDNVFQWEQIRRLENKADNILQMMKIPYALVEHYMIVEKNIDRTLKLNKTYSKEEKDVYL